ncbi:putative cysteine desulfurase [Phaeobacter italicus]|jgi:selenocysteine lyase/cysteine desulfurase|uniref:Putative cysteine desulfurase n=1 Tax=Phaeobacter italicus TaxID=481446 RepID=A0A0H5D2J8_9RHOB|nr:aminotransferase class V-fold PLP-dependent enzyme [Phaeobacter italicus]CRL10963.1 putative cysteine desulfurase [Phaeobacter italicus]
MTTFSSPSELLDRFSASLSGPDCLDRLRAGVIGEGAPLPGPNGPLAMIYADYVASGRALRQVEDFVLTEVLPYYANSHTEASYCGSFMTRLRTAARQRIAQICGADDRFATVFTGSGATAGLNRLVHLLGVNEAAAQGARPLVILGPYEHHSNILPWRESGAEVVEVPEAQDGGPDMAALEALLAAQTGGARLVVGAFSAASNVTGIVTDTDAVSRLLRRYGARVVWDYAGGGPYLPMDMAAGTDAEKDAIVFSAHKFLGGPGASGVMILRKAAVACTRPTLPGGGTVKFVSPWQHDYADNLAAREEAGTPNVVGDIRAALCLLVKEAMGAAFLRDRQEELRQRALRGWADLDNLHILGNPEAQDRLPIFSFQLRDPQTGALVHQQLFTRMLSDIYGVQARGGCACAGPYAHRLLGIDQQQSDQMRAAILAGQEIEKPGWTRLNFSALLSDEKADAIIQAVRALALDPGRYSAGYSVDTATARFAPKVA